MNRKSKPRQRIDETDEQFSVRLAEWRQADNLYMREYSRNRRARDKSYVDAIQASARAWKARNSERMKSARADHYAKNKDKENRLSRLWKSEHPETKPGYDSVYRKRHAEKIKAKRSTDEYKDAKNARFRKRYATDEQFRNKTIVRSIFAQALRLQSVVKRTSVIPLLGCSIEFLLQHLEAQFQPGMTWDNQGVWHIDHIRPCASFDLSDVEQQRSCFHYTNLQPLWGVENIRKKDKYEPSAPDVERTHQHS